MAILTIDSVVSEWKKDSVINDTNVQGELFKTPNLHSKFLEYYVFFKARLSSAEKKYNRMAYLRKRYYRGELTKQELDANGWDQFQGLKKSGSDLENSIKTDLIMLDLKEIVDMCETSVSTCQEILKSIQNRGWLLKTIVEHQKFLSGG